MENVTNSIREKENALFEKWGKIINTRIVPDGMVDETVWNKQKLKVLYLLKEVYDTGDSDWDERKYLREYSGQDNKNRSKTILNLCRWQFGLVQATGNEKWDEVVEKMYIRAKQDEVLAGICLVNVKKVGGEASVNWKSFNKYMSDANNVNFLEEQMSLYKPDVVICGNTGWILKKYCKGFNNWKDCVVGESKYSYMYRDGALYIDYYHPGAKIDRQKLYDNIRTLVQKLHK